MGKRLIVTAGAGPAGPAGPSGSSGSAGAAPAVLSTWISGLSIVLVPWASGYQYYVAATITPPSGTSNLSNLTNITVTTTLGSGSAAVVQDQTVIAGPFAIGTGVTLKSGVINTLDPSQGAITYGVSFQGSNADNATSTAYSTTVTITPPSISGLSASEYNYPSSRVADQQRGITTSVGVTGTMSNNPAGSGACLAVAWIYYDLGDSLGQRWIYLGPQSITGNGSFSFQVAGIWVSLLATQSATVKMFPGFVPDGSPIPSSGTASSSFTFLGPQIPTSGGAWITGANFTGLSSHLKYFSTGGGNFVFQFGTLAYSAKFVEIADLKSTRCWVQNGFWSGSTWTADPSDSTDKPFCDAEQTASDSNNLVTVSGDAVTVTPRVPWSVRPSAYAYPHVRIHVDADSASTGFTVQASFSGQTPSTSDIIFSSDGKYAYLLPSVAAAIASGAVPWDSGTINSTLTNSGGVLGVTPIAAAPAPLNLYTVAGGAGTATVQSTSAGTLPAVAGLPVWNVTGLITLDTGNANYARDKEIRVTLPGYPDLVIASWTPDGSGRIAYTTTTEYQDTSLHTLTISAFARNDVGSPSASVTASITVPAASIPWGTSSGYVPAPTPVAIVTASAGVSYAAYGHDWRPYFFARFTAPTDASAANKIVRISQISPSGVRSQVVPDVAAPSGGFVAASQYPSSGTYYTGDTTDWSPGTWQIEFLAVNADNIPATALQIPVTVAANIITAVTGAENTGARFIEPGGGAQTQVQIAATITTSGAPGFPQTLTEWISYDSGSTWNWLGWIDAASSGQAFSWVIWRPTTGNQTCKVACALGAINSTATLPGGTVQSSAFTLATVGAPAASDVTSAQIVDSTVTTGVNSDGVVYWDLPNGVQWTNPQITTDPNFFYSALTVQCTDPSGNPAPSNQQGTERLVAQISTPGLFVQPIHGWTFNPAGSIYTYFRFKIYAVSRSATAGWQDSTYSALQTTCWSGASFKLFNAGSPPATTILSSGAAPNVATGTATQFTEMVNGLPYAGVQGQVVLPSNVTNLYGIQPVLVGPNPDSTRRLQIGATLPAPFTGGATINYKGSSFLTPTANQTYTVEFDCYNAAGTLTASPVTTSVTITGTSYAGPTAPAAPNVTIPATPAQAYMQIAGQSYWYLTGKITLPTGYAQIQKIIFTCLDTTTGLPTPELLVLNGPFTPDGSNQISYTTVPIQQDSVLNHNITLTISVENSASAITSGAPTVATTIFRGSLGTGLGISGGLLANTGVTSVAVGAGISRSGATGDVTLTANVASLVNGTGITVSNSSGAWTITATGSGGITSVGGSGSGISVSTVSGVVTISNTGVTGLGSSAGLLTGGITLNGGTGITVSNNVPFAGQITISTNAITSVSGPGAGISVITVGTAVTVANTGVTGIGSSAGLLAGGITLTGGSGITVTNNVPVAGSITISNSGVTSISVAGTGLSVNQANGAVTITGSGSGVPNVNGITSAVNLAQGTGVTISPNVPVPGSITLSIGQSVATSAFVTFGGVTVTGSVWNSIQTTGGMRSAAVIQCGPLSTSDQSGSIGGTVFLQGQGNGICSIALDAYDPSGSDPSGITPTVAAIVGRRIAGSVGVYSQILSGQAIFTFGGRGSYAGGGFGSGVTSSNSAAITFQASENWTQIANGADIAFATVANGNAPGSRLNRMYIRNSGVVEVISVATTPVAPASGFSALVPKSGSQWQYFNTSTLTWGTVDFAASGGSVSINGFTGPFSFGGTNGVQVSAVSPGTFTIGLNTAASITCAGVISTTGNSSFSNIALFLNGVLTWGPSSSANLNSSGGANFTSAVTITSGNLTLSGSGATVNVPNVLASLVSASSQIAVNAGGAFFAAGFQGVSGVSVLCNDGVFRNVRGGIICTA